MTRAQLKPYWRAVSRAASALGLVGHDAVEEYRHTVLMEEVGAEHARDVDPAGGFDRVMYRLATDAGDSSAASRYATGEERRMARLVESCARQVIELKAIEEEPHAMFEPESIRAEDAALAYVVGCLRQARVSVVNAGADWWMDVSGDAAFSVFRMLDTHRRRLLRRLGWTGALSFDISASWSLDGAILTVGPAAAAPVAIRVGKPAA